MGATIQQEPNGIWLLRVFGALRKDELDAVQNAALQSSELDENAKVLVVVEDDFRGWVGEEVWNDMTFFIQHGDRIGRIAIVGDPLWKSRMLMFTGAGFRRTQVKYFTKDLIAEARDWLS